MSVSEKQVQALANAVAAWRLQENITTPFYALYIYYVLTTLDEESVPYWANVYRAVTENTHARIAVLGDYRTYLVASPELCKAWMIAQHTALALCLGALLQSKGFYLVGIMLLSIGPRIVGIVFAGYSDIQYPAEPITEIDKELGYPCYVVSSEDWYESTDWGRGRDIRAYIIFACTAVLFLLAVTAIVVRYKGHSGRLVNVLRRDGGLYYIALASIRFGVTLTSTPAILSASHWDSSAAALLLEISQRIAFPVFAQRLMINLRKADFVGTRPIASKLLFAPQRPGSEDGEDKENQHQLEIRRDNSHISLHIQEGDGDISHPRYCITNA
ncbi:hypothetical protein NMY22_g11462 [Coprinellus aureogranulatus]|nr:hypothetical protein NMY22_g11462 [Coprinellus aureogranulatus]